MTSGEHDPNSFGQPYPPQGYPQQGYPPPGYPPPAFPPPPSPYPMPGGYPAGAQPGWGPPSDVRPGGLGARFAARFVDGILVGIMTSVLATLTDSRSSILVTGMFTGVLMFGYFVAMEVTQGRTLGKMLLGLDVRGPGGTPKPDVKQSAIRNAFTLLPILPFIGGLLGVIAMIVIAVSISGSPTKQGKHDELAGGTQVIKR